MKLIQIVRFSVLVSQAGKSQLTVCLGFIGRHSIWMKVGVGRDRKSGWRGAFWAHTSLSQKVKFPGKDIFYEKSWAHVEAKWTLQSQDGSSHSVTASLFYGRAWLRLGHLVKGRYWSNTSSLGPETLHFRQASGLSVGLAQGPHLNIEALKKCSNVKENTLRRNDTGHSGLIIPARQIISGLFYFILCFVPGRGSSWVWLMACELWSAGFTGSRSCDFERRLKLWPVVYV